MSYEMFEALLQLMDAKIAEAAARDSSDGGLIETMRVDEFAAEFRLKYVVPYEEKFG